MSWVTLLGSAIIAHRETERAAQECADIWNTTYGHHGGPVAHAEEVTRASLERATLQA